MNTRRCIGNWWWGIIQGLQSRIVQLGESREAGRKSGVSNAIAQVQVKQIAVEDQ